MCKLYVYQTGIGPFFIAASSGYFRVIFENQVLGNYGSPEMAAEHVAGRHRFFVAGGFDTARLGLPSNLMKWERCVQVPN